MGLLRGAVLAAALVAMACGDGDVFEDGGGVDTAVADTGADVTARATPEPPAPPERPVLTPCPPGWREHTTTDGTPSCDPWPETGHAECAIDEAHFPGTPGCARLGPECPSSGFPEDLPPDRPITYVRAGASDGDGSIAAPYGTIADAIALGPANQVIALGVGEYPEDVTLAPGTALIGACVRESVVRGLVLVPDGEVEMRWLRVESAAMRPGVQVLGAPEKTRPSLRMQETVVVSGDGASRPLIANRAILDLERVAVRGGRGGALSVGDGSATIRFLEARSEDSTAVACLTSTLMLEDAAIFQSGTSGVALEGDGITARRMVVELDGGSGISVTGDGGDFEDLVIRGVGSADAFFAATDTRCERCLIEGEWRTGLTLLNATATIRDLWAGGRIGEECRARSVAGMNAEFVTLEIERAVFADWCTAGFFAGRSTVTGSDIVVRGVGPDEGGKRGRGFEVNAGSRVDLLRLEVTDAHTFGVLVDGSEVTLRDLSVHDIASRTVDGQFGRGVQAQQAATVTVERGRIERTREVAVLSGQDSELTMIDAVVSGILPRDCASTTCEGFEAGHGLGAYLSGRLAMERFAIEDAASCGLQVADTSTMNLRDGIVRRTLVGACIQSDAQDLAALSQNVAYEDNGVNLQATELPIPDITPP